jgi:hypothetical protein
MLNDEAKNDQNSVQVTGESETLNAEGERGGTGAKSFAYPSIERGTSTKPTVPCQANLAWVG